MSVRAILCLFLVALPVLGWSQPRYSVLVDTDNDAATGCTVTIGSAGTVAGVEQRLSALVSTTPSFQVTTLSLENCAGGAFGAPIHLPGTPYPVGLNSGNSGADVVELAAARALLAPGGGPVRLYFSAHSGASADLLATAGGISAGAPILFDFQSPTPIPTLSGVALLLLALLLLTLTLGQRHRLPPTLLSVALLLLVVIGVVGAAHFSADGQINDWSGLAPIASDLSGDSAPASDLTTVYAAEEAGNAFFRLDITDTDAPPAPNQAPAFTSTAPTTATVGSPYTYAVSATDPDANALTLSAPTLPAWLTLTDHGDGTGVLSGTPLDTDRGAHPVVLRVSDHGSPALSADQSFTITVSTTGGNGAPTATPQSLSTPEDSALTITLSGTDPEADPLTFALASAPAHGTLSAITPVNATRASVTYTPNPNFNGADPFTFTVSDASATSAPAPVAITVSPVNDPPSASAQNLVTARDTALALTLSGTDPDNDPLTFAIATNPTNGTLSGTPPALTYTPHTGFTGTDRFTFTANDGVLTSAPATVTLTVGGGNAPPVANGQSVSTLEDTAAGIVLTGSDPNSDPLTFAVVTPPTHGTLSGSAPTLTYTPSADFNGSDSFTFTVNDGTVASPPATVTITVTAVNDAPSASAQTLSTPEDSALTITLTGADPEASPLTFAIATAPGNGTLGAITPVNATRASVVYTPALNVTGPDSFTFTVNDGALTSAPAPVTITVGAAADAPVVDLNGPGAGLDFAASFSEAAAVPVAIVASAALTVSDPDSATLASATVTLTNLLDAGVEVLAVDPATVAPNTPIVAVYDTTTPGQGVLTLSGAAPLTDYQAALRTLTYANTSANPTATDRLVTVVVNDGGLTSAPATSTITLVTQDDPPTAVADTATLTEDAPATAIDVLANDTDPDAGPKTIASITQPAHGTVAITGGGTGLTYAPSPNDCNTPPGTPLDTFTYTLAPAGTTPTATVTVTVNCVNDAPSFTAAAPPAVLEDSGAQTVSGWVTTFNPGPADEAAQTVLAYTVSNVSNAALFAAAPAVATNGTLTYTPAANAFGASTFQVRAQDSGGSANGGVDTSAAQTFTITVTAVNDAPSFTAVDPPAVAEDAGAQTVSNWASFNPGNAPESAQTVLAYTVSHVSNAALFAAGGAPAVAASGTLTYTPAANQNGTSTFDVAVQDSGGTANGGVDTSSPAQTFTITVTAVDDPPTAVDDAATVNEDDPASAIAVLANDTDLDAGPQSIASVTQPANGAVVITGAGTGLTYQPNPNYCNNPPGTTLDTFTYTLNGGSTATVSVTVTCVNDAPVVDLDGTADDPGGDRDFATTFTEGEGATAIVDSANLTVTDLDSATLAAATVTLTNLLDAGVEVLAVDPATLTPNTPISAAYDTTTPGQGILTLSGTATLAQYQAALRTVTYDNPSANPNTSARSLTFVVNDGAAASAVATSTVAIESLNAAPSFTKGADQTVLEDSGAHTVNPWATAINDGDGGGQTLTFTITGNTNPSLFSAGPAVSPTGVLTYTPAANANGTATITLTLQDNGGTANGGVDTSAPQSFTITVTAVNDAPSFTKGANPTVLEDVGAQTVNPWASAISAGPADEAGQTLTFTVTGNTNAALFSVAPAVSPTGGLTYTPAANANGTATITLTLQDSGGTANGGVDTSPTQTFVITVTAVDDPPVAVNDSATVSEDDPASAIAVLANDTDLDAGPQSIASATQPAHGAVVITGAGAGLTYQPNPNYCNNPPGTTPDTFTYTLAPGSSSATVSVTVTCVNDAPVVDLDGTADDPGGDRNFAATFTEGTPKVIVDAANLTVTDIDNTTLAAATVTITNLLDVGQETLSATPSGAIVAGDIVYAAPTLTITHAGAPLADFQAVLRTVTYNNTSPNPNTTARSVSVVVNDGTTNSAVATSTVTVISINAAPSFTPGPNPTVNEDAGAQTVNPWATAINDGDGGGQTLTFTITGNTNPSLFSAGPAVSPTGVLTYTPAANANGSATITLTLSDNGGTANGGVDTSAPQSFTITVTAVNDAPSFTQGANPTVLEDAGAQTVNPWASAISAGPADEAGQTLTFTVTGNTNAALFSVAPAVSPTGRLTYTPAPNANGTATITLTLQDSGGTANGGVNTSAPQSFTITVTAVNDAPSFTKGADPTVLEDAGAQTVNPWASAISAGPADEAGQTLTFTVTGNTNPSLFSAGPAVAANGTLTYTPAANQNGSATITLRVQDNGGTANGGVDTSAPQSFTINVTPVNDPPTVTPPANYAAQAHIGIAIPDGPTDLFDGSVITDVDGPGTPPRPFTLTAATVASANGGSATVNANGSFSYNPPANFPAAGVASANDTFSYQICDSGIPLPSQCTTATATVVVSGPRVWFVNNTGAAGDGRLSNPFNTLAAADTAANGTGDRIFVFTSATPYTGGFTLLDSQRLVGQGVVDTDFDTALGITPPATSVARPAINGTRPTLSGTIVLAPNVHARGFNVNNTTVDGITGSGASGLTINQVSVAVTTGTAPTGSAVSLVNSAGTVSFTSISANGAANGIVLNNTTGSFTVTGTGAAGTGGTIQNATGPGISLTSASNVNLSSMNVQNGGDDGINGSSVTGITLNALSVTNNGNSTTDEGIELLNPAGAMVFTNVTVTGNAHNNVFIDDTNNTGGNSSLTVSGGTIGNHQLPDPANNGNSGMLVTIRGTATLGVSTISGTTFENNRVLGLQVTGGDTANISDLTVSGNIFRDTGTGNSQEISVDFSKAQTSSMTVKMLNNTTIMNHNSHAMNFFTGADVVNPPAGTYNARIEGNIIGNTAVAGSGSRIGNCTRINNNGGTDTAVLVNNQNMRQCPNGRGVEVISRNGTGGIDITITNNDINPQDTSGFPLSAILAQSNTVTVGNTLRADVRGNTVPSGTTTDLLTGYISLVETSTSTLELVDTPSGPGGQTCAQQLAAASPANTGSVAASAGCALIPGPISTPP
ncbi:MAG: Ig-like domain-containing protein [Gammaproteobacteria bacterium]